VLYWKKRAEETCGTSQSISVPLSFFFDSSLPFAWFFLRRASFWPIILLTRGGVRRSWSEVSVVRGGDSYSAKLGCLLCDPCLEFRLQESQQKC
jgi:hypothetical protein